MNYMVDNYCLSPKWNNIFKINLILVFFLVFLGIWTINNIFVIQIHSKNKNEEIIDIQIEENLSHFMEELKMTKKENIDLHNKLTKELNSIKLKLTKMEKNM